MRTVNLASGLAAIKALDLSMVGKKIMESPPEGKGWSEMQVAEATLWYKRYLVLCLRYPDAAIVPNYPIDSIWHQHILDTRAYSEDCDKIFGEMLHHFPYFGLRGEEDAQNRDDSFDQTNDLYRKHFGEDCTMMSTFTHPPAFPPFPPIVVDAMGCNSGGSGTGCGQSCSRGGKVRDTRLVAQTPGPGSCTSCQQNCKMA